MSEHGFFQITQKVFLRDGQKLLVMRDRKSGHGDLPGGRMNESEFFADWLNSIDREIHEELGSDVIAKVSPKPIFVFKHRVNEGNFPCIILAYKGDFISGKIEMSDEHDFWDWVDIKTYDPSIFFSEFMLDAVRMYLKEYA